MSTANNEGLPNQPLSKPLAVDPGTHQTEHPVVSVVTTKPDSVLDDIESSMTLAGIQQHFTPEIATLLKINIS